MSVKHAIAVGVIAVLFIGGVAAGGVAADTATQDSESVEGLLYPIPGDMEAEFQSQFERLAEQSGAQAPSNVALLYVAESDTTYIVGTDEEIRPGAATVTGAVATPQELGTDGTGLAIATSIEVRQQGTRVDLADLQANPEQYEGELVRVKGHMAATGYALNIDGVQSQQTYGAVSESSGLMFLDKPPGRVARYALFNITQADEIRRESRYDAGFRAGWATGGQTNLTVAYDDTRFWQDAPTTVDLMVIPREAPTGTAARPYYFAVQSQVQPSATVSPAELRSNPQRYKGEIVAVEANGVGAAISAQETLVAVSKCAPDVVFVPPSPEPCIPAVVDVNLRTGVLAQPDAPTQAVPYVGLSNHVQSEAVLPEQGSYRVVGRVVSSGRLATGIDAPVGLLVMERNRTGDATFSASDRQQLLERAEAIEDGIRAQLTNTESEYKNFKTQFSSSNGSGGACASAPGYNIRLAKRGIHSYVLAEQHSVSVLVSRTGQKQPSTGLVSVTANGEVLREKCVSLGLDGVAYIDVNVTRSQGPRVDLKANGQDLEDVRFRQPVTPYVSTVGYGSVEPGETVDLELYVTNYAEREISREFLIVGPDQNRTVSVSIPANGSTTTEFEVTAPDETGEFVYYPAIEPDYNATITVEAQENPSTATSSSGPGFGVIATLLSVLSLTFALKHRRR